MSASVLDRLSSALSARYRVERELGHAARPRPLADKFVSRLPARNV